MNAAALCDHSAREAALDEAAGILCALLSVGALFGLVAWWTARIRRESADAIRDLRRRVTSLESRANALARAEAAPPPSSPAPPPSPPAAAPDTGWIATSSAARAETVPVPAPAAAAVPAPATAPPASPAAPQASFESFVGGRVLLVAGVVVALFGIGFFLKYMIDRGWFGEAARVATGAVAGAALLVFGDRLRRRGFDVFGQALMGCGLGAVYLSNYFACDRFLFFDRTTGFAFAAVLTAAGVALALWRGAPLLAYLGLLGGYLAPALLSERSGDLAALTTWLTVIDAGALVVTLARRWRGFDCLSLLFTLLYVSFWLDRYDGNLPVPAQSVFGSLAARTGVTLLLAFVPAIRRREGPPPESLAAAALAGVWCAATGHDLLFPQSRAELAAAVALLGGLYFVAARLVARAGDAVAAQVESLLAFTVAALTMAIATAVSGSAVAPSLSIVGVAVVFAGARSRHPALTAGGVAMVVAAFGDVLANRLGGYEPGTTPFWNARFPVVVSPCVAMLAAGAILRRPGGPSAELAHLVGALGLVPLQLVLGAEANAAFGRESDAQRELRVAVPTMVAAAYALAAARLFGRGSTLGRLAAFAPLAIAGVGGVVVLVLGHRQPFSPFLSPAFGAGLAVVLAAAFAAGGGERVRRRVTSAAALVHLLAAVTAEIWWWGQRRELTDTDRAGAEFTAIVWISVAWALYAAALVAAGFARKDAALRWMGLGVFALTLGKVFLVDLAQLEAVYRIGSFLVLGVLLVAASFLYQRARRTEPPER